MGISQSRTHSQGHQRPQWAAHIPRLPLQCLSPSKALQNVRCRNQGPLPPDWSLGRGSRRRNSTDNELGTNQCFQQGQPLTKARQRLQVSGTHARVTGREQLYKGWARGMLEGALQPGVGSTGAAWLRTW